MWRDGQLIRWHFLPGSSAPCFLRSAAHRTPTMQSSHTSAARHLCVQYDQSRCGATAAEVIERLEFARLLLARVNHPCPAVFLSAWRTPPDTSLRARLTITPTMTGVCRISGILGKLWVHVHREIQMTLASTCFDVNCLLKRT